MRNVPSFELKRDKDDETQNAQKVLQRKFTRNFDILYEKKLSLLFSVNF